MRRYLHGTSSLRENEPVASETVITAQRWVPPWVSSCWRILSIECRWYPASSIEWNGAAVMSTIGKFLKVLEFIGKSWISLFHWRCFSWKLSLWLTRGLFAGWRFAARVVWPCVEPASAVRHLLLAFSPFALCPVSQRAFAQSSSTKIFAKWLVTDSFAYLGIHLLNPMLVTSQSWHLWMAQVWMVHT